MVRANGAMSAQELDPLQVPATGRYRWWSGSVCKRLCLHDKDGTDAEAAPTAAALGKPRIGWRMSRPVNLLFVVFFNLDKKGAAIGDLGR
jgi:hypothetical protein